MASGGVGRVLATQGWQCQEFLAFAAPSPLKIGTARDFRRLRSLRHPGLAVPGIAGSLARFSGTARVFWLLQPQRPHAPIPTPVTELSFDPNASS